MNFGETQMVGITFQPKENHKTEKFSAWAEWSN